MPDDNYWMTSAQIMAVLALALVLEARFYASKWTGQIPSWVRAIQISIFLVPMLGMAIAIPGCLNALRTGSPGPWLPEIVRYSVSTGIVALILNPAMDLVVRVFSRHFATLLARGSVRSWSIRILYWRLRARRLYATRRKNIAKYEREVRSTLAEIEDLRREINRMPGTNQSPEVQQALERVARWEANGAEFLEKLDESRRDMDETWAKRLEDAAQFKARVRRQIKELSSQIDQQILSNGIFVVAPIESGDDRSQGDGDAGGSQQDGDQSGPK